jgi:hypothetical protein
MLCPGTPSLQDGRRRIDMRKTPPLLLGLAAALIPFALRTAGDGAAAAQRVPVDLAWRVAGDDLTLTAVTAGKGVDCRDRWWTSPGLSIASKTAADADRPHGYDYISRAVVPASSLEADTTYTFSYSIIMRSGDEVWMGSAGLALTIGAGGAPPASAGAGAYRAAHAGYPRCVPK